MVSYLLPTARDARWARRLLVYASMLAPAPLAATQQFVPAAWSGWGAASQAALAAQAPGSLAQGGGPRSSVACSPGWFPGFGNIAEPPGLDDSALAMAEYDDGSGTALYMGGRFILAGSVPAGHIAKWDGVRWSALAEALDGVVRALAVFDDGSGPGLYAGGDFLTADGLTVNHVARWDGAAWQGLGSGVNATVRALVVFEDLSGGGPALYAGGDFTNASGVPTSRVARWNGSSWAPVGTGISNSVNSLASFDSGSGMELIAGGAFTLAGGVVTNHVARFSGSNWEPLGAGLTGGVVKALVRFDGGGGPELIAGGGFTKSGSLVLDRIARWDGSSWSAMAGGFSGVVRALAVSAPDGPDGSALYAGGSFAFSNGTNVSNLALWDGTSWSPLLGGVNGAVDSLALHDAANGAGPVLHVSGVFSSASGTTVSNVARWNGSQWSSFAGGLDGGVTAVEVHDSGNGLEFYAGGNFTTSDGVTLDHIARWSGFDWIPLGAGMDAPVSALVSHAGALYAGGSFLTAGGVVAHRIACWSQGAWSAVGGGTSGQVFALASSGDNGPDGAALYAGGLFTSAGGVAVNGIARWNGSVWSPVGDAGNAGIPFVLTLFDDGLGGGPTLIAGGNFLLMGGTPVNRIARWDGVSWSPLGAGMNGVVLALAGFDDGLGGGVALYAGGTFTQADGQLVNHIARWDGVGWSALGSGAEVGVSGNVRALAVYDDGTGGGPALHVGGDFTTAGSLPASCVARWDGATWSALGGGVNDRALAMVVFDDHNGAESALYVGGDFNLAPDSGDGFLARWGGCGAPGPGWSDQGFALPGVNGDPSLVGLGNLAAGTSNAAALSRAAPGALVGVFVAFSGNPVPFKGGMLVPFPFLGLAVVPADAAGDLMLPFGMPAGLPAGTELWIQCAVQDAVAVKGVALSNALRGVTP